MGSPSHRLRLGCKVDNKATGSVRFATHVNWRTIAVHVGAHVNWRAAKNEILNLPLFLIPIEFEGAEAE